MTKASFTLDPLEEKRFEGFTTGQRWNGWACPLFTKDQAEKIVQAWREKGYKADFDALSDSFRFAPIDQQGDSNPNLSDEEVVEHFPAMNIEGEKVYPVGAGAWVWDEVEHV